MIPEIVRQSFHDSIFVRISRFLQTSLLKLVIVADHVSADWEASRRKACREGLLRDVHIGNINLIWNQYSRDSKSDASLFFFCELAGSMLQQIHLSQLRQLV